MVFKDQNIFIKNTDYATTKSTKNNDKVHLYAQFDKMVFI